MSQIQLRWGAGDFAVNFWHEDSLNAKSETKVQLCRTYLGMSPLIFPVKLVTASPITSVPDQRALVATRSIRKHEIVFVERPVLRVCAGERGDEDASAFDFNTTERLYMENSVKNRTSADGAERGVDENTDAVETQSPSSQPGYFRQLKVAFEKLSGNDKNEIFSLHDSFATSLSGGAKTIFGIHRTNNLSDNGVIGCLAPYSALFNHSCAPNIANFAGEDGKQTFYATEDIEENAELCHTYINAEKPKVDRGADLKDSYNYVLEKIFKL